MPTDEIEAAPPSQLDTLAFAEPTTPSEFVFDDDPMTLFPELNGDISFSSNHTSSPLPPIEKFMESSSTFLNQNSPRQRRNTSNTLESIENLGFNHIPKQISDLKNQLSELEAKKINASLRKDRKESNRIFASISRIKKTISELQDQLEIKQSIKTMREKDTLIETLQNTIAQQAKIIQDLKQQLFSSNNYTFLLMESSNATFLNQASKESIDLSHNNISDRINALKTQLLALEAKRTSANSCKDREESKRLSASISRINKKISGLQDQLEIKQSIKTMREKDTLIEILESTIAQQPKIIQDLKQQLKNQTSKKRKTHP